jgi:class 3 adenylate cyclase
MPKMSILSSRELQIAQAYALGSNYRQIADRLCISPSTVRTHLRTIYRKLGVSSKIGLLRVLEDADPHGADVFTVGSAPHKEEPSPATELRERCHLSLVACSLANAANLLAGVDAEDLSDLAAAFRDCTRQVVGRYRGHVIHVMDCSMTACFGYPHVDEHDAESAVCAALELVTELKVLAGSSLPGLNTRIGVASGEVVVDRRIRDDGLIQEEIAGEALHIVAALQRIAEPDSVLVAESTKRLLGDLFEYQDHGDRLLEGADLSIRTWQVLGERSGQSRFQAIRGAMELGSLVGRDEQMDLLTRRWQRAKAGVGHVVVLTGEPGIGKSRLIRALCESVANEPHYMLSYHCSPHHQDSVLYPVIYPSEVVPLVADLLSIPAQVRYPPLKLTQESQKAKPLEVLGAQIAGLAKQKPVLVVFEDLQWGEPITRELVDWLVERVRTMPALVLISQRADARLPWVGDPGVTSLALSRLDHRDSEKLVLQRLGGKRLPRQWLALIVAMADGVPLFLEELTRNVIETHAADADPEGNALGQSLD